MRGIRDYNSRKELFYFVKQHEIDIMLIQETHCTDRVEKLWANQWGGQSLLLQWNILC